MNEQINAEEHIWRVAVASLAIAAGGELRIKHDDVLKMPDGELMMHFAGEDLEFIYDRRAKVEHMDRIAGEAIQSEEMHNTQVLHLGLAVTTINAGNVLRLKSEHLAPVLTQDGSLAIDSHRYNGDIVFTWVAA